MNNLPNLSDITGMMLRLANPWMLLLLLPLLAAGWRVWSRRRQNHPQLKYSSLSLLGAAARPTLRSRLIGLPAALVFLAAMLMVLAMARPQTAWRERKQFAEGIDIMLVIDCSGSMAALDFTPNRLEKAKLVVKDFIKGRTDDRIGLVVFARNTFTLCPLTSDYAALLDFVDRISFKLELVDKDQTAIGMGLANAVNKLRVSKAKSKVVVLLTDGENNAGQIDPLAAANIAKSFGIRVYTIGVGSPSGIVQIPNPNAGPFEPPVISIEAKLDADQLTQIAKMNGGKFFRATDDKSLEQIWNQIDKMERTRVEVSETHFFDELAQYLMIPALALLLLALALENTWLRTFP